MQAKNRHPATRRGSLAAAALPVALSLTIALAGAPAAPAEPIAARISSTRQQIALARQKEGVLTTTISRYTRRIGRLQGEVAVLRSRGERVQRQLELKQAELRRARAELRRERIRLHRLRLKLRRSIRILEQRLVAIYKSDQPDILTVVLESDGFADLLERTDYLGRIGDQDKRVVGRVRELRNQSRASVARLTSLERRVEAARDAIAAKRRELARARGALEHRQGALTAVRGRKRAALGGIRGHRRELEGNLHILEAQEASIRATLLGGPAPGITLRAGPIRQGGSGMIWPVNGPVVSGFGPRWGRLHAGIDISAPGGTPIRAAKAGLVALAAPQSGYGNYVCVNHGGGLSTCYAHLSAYATGAGASVGQGQVIGYVGCTGHCYGDHLHFEVRVGGVPTDPMGYL